MIPGDTPHYSFYRRVLSTQSNIFMAREGIYGLSIRIRTVRSDKVTVRKSHLISWTYADALLAVAFVFITVKNFLNSLSRFQTFCKFLNI